MAETRTPAEFRERTAWSEAAAWGCDMAHLERQLELSVRDRLRRHDRALASARALRDAVEARRARS